MVFVRFPVWSTK